MEKFKKLVAIEPVNLYDESFEIIKSNYAEDVIIYNDVPKSNEEIIKRIGDADAMLVSYTSQITKDILEKCPNLKYVGMCCSLYSPESASVDIRYSEAHGIKVTGIRNYGDNGVAEYAVHQMIDVLHGFGDIKWNKNGSAVEITNAKVGILGMGTTGKIIANALSYFGADISYNSRTHKADMEEKGCKFMEFDDLITKNDFIFCCLTKNIILLNEREFNLMKGKKLIFNTSIAPAHDINALKNWLIESDEHYFFGDSNAAIGSEELLKLKNVRSTGRCSGGTIQCIDRLNEKVLANIKNYFAR